MSASRRPSLYQINTRVWLTELSRALGRPAILDDVPDAALDEWARLGFDWIWLLSVWQTGDAARHISRSNSDWRREFEETLPDLREEDIAGSGFAIKAYHVHEALGGDAALVRLRERLRQRGLKLMLDFVPNHVAPDHPWIRDHPEYFVMGSDLDLARQPGDYFNVMTPAGPRVAAHGRDPYFPGWPDTIQLNYGNPELQEAMAGELLRIAAQCDGVRCDMAMLVLPEVFRRTWDIEAAPFWPRVIPRVREQLPGFIFMAEVYWDLEWTLQQQGFDYCYDKRLYDRLREGCARPVREHLFAGLDYQDRLTRFLENHDEPRAAAAFDADQLRAAAAITYLAPGLRFFHQGQLEGRRVRISPHLVRAPMEHEDERLSDMYARLLAFLRLPAVREGAWRLLASRPAWEGNGSCEDIIAYWWEKSLREQAMVVVNYAPHPSQARLWLPFDVMERTSVHFHDCLQEANYAYAGSQLVEGGLYVELPAWGVHLFDVVAS
jgi:glycosidase